MGSFWYGKVGVQKLSGFLCDGAAVHRLHTFVEKTAFLLHANSFSITRRNAWVTQNPKNGDLVGHNGFGNPFFGSQWVHFVKFSSDWPCPPDPAGQPFFRSQISLAADIRPGQSDLVGHGDTRTRRHHTVARLD